MQRIAVTPRRNWQNKVEELGLIWHSVNGDPYWNESACYQFSMRQVDEIERATGRLYELFLEAGQYVIDKNLFASFGIPETHVPLVIETWNAEPPALNYGRFDLGFDGKSHPKLFEFNCDTPTSLVEAAVIQWFWKEEVFPSKDQFNSLHDKLVAKWKDIKPFLKSPLVHFAHVPDTSSEDTLTTAYMMDTAREAGLDPHRLAMADIGWRSALLSRAGRFVDLEGRDIETLYKLYPWEWLVSEPFGKLLPEDRKGTFWIEPIWKMIWSNKAILPILWEISPKHPNLLWAGHQPPATGDYVSKPILGREGANVTIFRNGREAESSGGSHTSGLIYQSLYELPDFRGHRPVIGSWIVDGYPAGMGIREDGPITSNLARFVPHIISG